MNCHPYKSHFHSDKIHHEMHVAGLVHPVYVHSLLYTLQSFESLLLVFYVCYLSSHPFRWGVFRPKNFADRVMFFISIMTSMIMKLKPVSSSWAHVTSDIKSITICPCSI